MTQRNTGETTGQQKRNGTAGNVCPDCKNTGWKTVVLNGVDYAEECVCRKRRIMKRRMAFAELPEAFLDARLSNFCFSSYRTDEGKRCAIQSGKAIKYWLDNFAEMQGRGMGLYLFSGTKGSGKTRMAASITNELMSHGIQVKFTTSVNALNRIRSTWGRSYQEEYDILSYLSECEVLVLDDFGTEASLDWMAEKFYQIIDNRYVSRKVTIFTSNMSMNDLTYDDRITNRIRERVYPIPFPEESVRDYIAMENRKEILMAVNGK